jgi:hypothetical protein
VRHFSDGSYPRRLVGALLSTALLTVGLQAATPALASASTYSSAVTGDGASDYWRFSTLTNLKTNEISGSYGDLQSASGSSDSGAIVGDSSNSVGMTASPGDWIVDHARVVLLRLAR